MSLLESAASLIWRNYIDMQNDVKPYLQIPWQTTTSDVVLQLVTDYVCQASQEIMGKPIAPTTFDRRFDGWNGWNGAYIELPYYPVLEILEVNEYWGVAGPHLLVEQTPTNQVDGFQIDYRTGRLIRVFPGLVQKPWFPGSRNIEVQWVAGYNPIPALYKLQALEIIKEWWGATQQASRSVSAAGMDVLDATTDTYPGLPRRLRSIFSTQSQVGIG